MLRCCIWSNENESETEEEQTNCLAPSPNKPATDNECEADCLGSIGQTASLRVEYYQLFTYSLKWEAQMSPRRSSSRLKTSKGPQRSVSPTQDVSHPNLRGKRPRAKQSNNKLSKSVVTPVEGQGRDLLDIIDNGQEDVHVEEKDEGKFAEPDELDDDGDSFTGSIASGPSLPFTTHADKLRCLESLCPTCCKLYQKAKKMKAPIDNKPLDIDPKSLTCDQWVLIKSCRPKRLPDTTGKLLIHLKRIKEGCSDMKNPRRPWCLEEEPALSCPRPHTLLQRNLKQCLRVSEKKQQQHKKNRGKRARQDPQGPRTAKQRRLHGSSQQQHKKNRGKRARQDSQGPRSAKLQRLHGSSQQQRHSIYQAHSEEWSEEEKDDPSVPHLCEAPPNSVRQQPPPQPKKVVNNPKAQNKSSRFGDLLAQSVGNSSKVFRESR